MYRKYIPLLGENSSQRTLPFKYLTLKLAWKYFFKNSYQFNVFIIKNLKVAKMFHSSVKNDGFTSISQIPTLWSGFFTEA